MSRKLIFSGVVAVLALAVPASAQVTIEMSQISCKDFAGYDGETKNFIANWMRGYFSSTKNMTVVDSRYVKRNTEKVERYCKKLPKSSLMEAVQKNAR
jgi:acid stress chaperone HdeB